MYLQSNYLSMNYGKPKANYPNQINNRTQFQPGLYNPYIYQNTVPSYQNIEKRNCINKKCENRIRLIKFILSSKYLLFLLFL
jgi:hypothetical protein